MADGKPRRGPRAITVDLPKQGEITVYAGAKVADALQELAMELNLYQGVRLSQVLEAAYEQGQRDGRRDVFEAIDQAKELPELKHRNPGRPKKKAPARKAKRKKAPARKAKKKGS